ncbi:MAG TPA: peroxiredoxin-like family protein [Propylenella sp.]
MAAQPLIEALEVAVERARGMDASVNERLTVIANEVRSLNPHFAGAVERLIARLQQSGAGASAPAPGDPMPPFVLPDEDGNLVDLDGLLAEGPVAIAFNRGHWCPYCRINTVALSEAHHEAAATGGQIVAIVPDMQKFTSELKADSGAPFPILTDIDNGYALSLNLLVWVGAEMQDLIPRAGADVPAAQGNNAWMVPIPATFVVGTDGIIKARHVDPDYRKRMEIDDLLGALRNAG